MKNNQSFGRFTTWQQETQIEPGQRAPVRSLGPEGERVANVRGGLKMLNESRSPYLLGRFFDDLHVSDTEHTRARTITEADIVMWCSLTGDWFSLHSDAISAKKSIFGQRIAPGMLILAVTGGLGVPPDSRSIVANYGMDHVRFVAPVFIGDTIHARIEVLEKTTRDDGQGVVDFSWDSYCEEKLVGKSVLRLLMTRVST